MPTSHIPTAPRQWLDYDTGSAYLGVTRRQLQRLVAEKKIGYTRLGLRTLFTAEHLDAFIEAQTFSPER